jgi:hypothetical protein
MTTEPRWLVSMAGIATLVCCGRGEPPQRVPAQRAWSETAAPSATRTPKLSPELERLPRRWAAHEALSPALREAWQLTSELTTMTAPAPPLQTQEDVHRTWMRDAYAPWHRQRLQLFDRIMTAVGEVERAGAARENVVAAVLAAIAHESLARDWSKLLPIGCEPRTEECRSTKERLDREANGWLAGAVEKYGYCAYHASKDATMDEWTKHCHARLDDLERTTGQRL